MNVTSSFWLGGAIPSHAIRSVHLLLYYGSVWQWDRVLPFPDYFHFLNAGRITVGRRLCARLLDLQAGRVLENTVPSTILQ
jgi:hypothetical protein